MGAAEVIICTTGEVSLMTIWLHWSTAASSRHRALISSTSSSKSTSKYSSRWKANSGMSAYAPAVTLVIRGCSVDPGIELAEIHLIGVGVHQYVDLEEAAVALTAEPVPEPPDEVTCLASQVFVQHFRVHLIAAPAAAVWRELPVSGQLGHERADNRAAAREDGFDGDQTLLIRLITLTSLPLMSR